MFNSTAYRSLELVDIPIFSFMSVYIAYTQIIGTYVLQRLLDSHQSVSLWEKLYFWLVPIQSDEKQPCVCINKCSWRVHNPKACYVRIYMQGLNIIR